MASPEALCGRLQIELDLKSRADQYYKLYRSEAHQIPKATPGIIQAVALHEGEWHSHGAIKIWSYTIDGKSEVFKEKGEFDDDSLTITFNCIEGHVLSKYKVFRTTLKLVPKNKGCVVKLGLEYERLNEDVPIPSNYMDLMVSFTKEIDDHIHATSA